MTKATVTTTGGAKRTAKVPIAASQLDPSKVPLADIIRGLTSGQAWRLMATLAAIVVAAIAAGKWIEGWQREKAISAAVAPKDLKIADLSAKIVDLDAAAISDEREIAALSMRVAASMLHCFCRQVCHIPFFGRGTGALDLGRSRVHAISRKPAG